MRINFYVACVLTAIGLGWFAWTQRRGTPVAATA
jgi:hypothetical protein